MDSRPTTAPPKETLTGSAERVTFYNGDNGYAVVKVKARGKRDLIPVVGPVASISAGEFIHAVGVWITDRTHGVQFKADFLKVARRGSTQGIENTSASAWRHGLHQTDRGGFRRQLRGKFHPDRRI